MTKCTPPRLVLDPHDPAGADTVYIVAADNPGEIIIRCMDRNIRDWIIAQSAIAPDLLKMLEAVNRELKGLNG